MERSYSISAVRTGNIPPTILRLAKKTGKAIKLFNLTDSSDKIQLGISGGKDSLAMSLLLSIQRDFFKNDLELFAVMVEWKEFPFNAEQKDKLFRYFEGLGIPFEIVKASLYSEKNKDLYTCYTCARNRKLLLFEHALSKGISKIAFGHHLDDIAETALINLVHRGKIDTMQVKQDFFNGKISLIRPLALIRESEIRNIAEKFSFPVVEIDCQKKELNPRYTLKPIIHDLEKIDKKVREHILQAHFF